MARRGTFQKLRPLSLLEHLSNCYDSAHLKISSNSVSWSIYLEQGKIIYASHSVDPFERLERHLRRLNSQSSTILTIDSETIAQMRLMFDADSLGQSTPNSDYQAICWLVERQYLKPAQATALIEKLVKEVIESFLLVKEGTYELGYQPDALPEFGRLALKPIVEYCQKQLQGWQSLGPQIWSPYQRPYFLMRTRDQEQLLAELQQKFSGMLKGFSFRHLAVLLNQDELQLAQSLHPYIKNRTVFLYEPISPFEQLPKTFEEIEKPFHQLLETPFQSKESVDETEVSANNISADRAIEIPDPPTKAVENLETSKSATDPKVASPLPGVEATPVAKSTYKIVCVDDSPTMLEEIRHFLDDESFSVFTVSDPVKALMQIVRQKPDLILLDVRMANIDGYELCRLLRNHSLFKNTPIIMVTGNTGIIDRVKARVVGASGYLTKPFTKADLLKIIFKYLTK